MLHIILYGERARITQRQTVFRQQKNIKYYCHESLRPNVVVVVVFISADRVWFRRRRCRHRRRRH